LTEARLIKIETRLVGHIQKGVAISHFSSCLRIQHT